MNLRTTGLLILASFVLGFILTTLPLLGWSSYALEEALTSCSVEWNKDSVSVLSYNIVMFTVVFAIPVVIIIFSYVKILIAVSALFKLSLDIYGFVSFFKGIFFFF